MDQTNTKVFISYSWTPEPHKIKVMDLAKRLTEDGVMVVLDEWDLRNGNDKYAYMERMVADSEVQKVLLMCNKDYTEKANKRDGGVGTESLIISDIIYKKAEQTKFIPVVLEFDDEGKAFLPVFVKSRIYINLSNDEVYEEEYEKLLRDIYGKPKSRRPPLGTMPSYLNEEEVIRLPTAHKVKAIERSLQNGNANAKALIKDYYDGFITALDTYLISEEGFTKDNYEAITLKKMDDLLVLRDDFIGFLETYIRYSDIIDKDYLHRFWERVLEWLWRQDSYSFIQERSLGYMRLDSMRFFIYELFLYFSAVMIEGDRYEELGFVLHNPYIISSQWTRRDSFTFVDFKSVIYTLNELMRNKYSYNGFSYVGEYIKRRAGHDRYNYKLIEQTDALLYFISLFISEYDFWVPEIGIYAERIDLMRKAKSRRHFIKMMPLFDVSNVEDFQLKVRDIVNKNKDRIDRFFYRLPKIAEALNVENVGLLK